MGRAAQGLAAAPVKFGSKLNPTIQNEAYGRPDGGEFAPKTGTTKKIRIIAGGPGSFRPQIATVKHSASTTPGATDVDSR